MDSNRLYKDIQARTNGEIYIGTVGPVRSGKSTFIKRFMDVLVLPKMTDDAQKTMTRDELPQSASGKMIMTTEPKFIPKEAAKIRLLDDTSVKIRLIDCVGYMVDGALGHMEGDGERKVKTPWFDHDIPFTKAAEIGTRKVIHDHATIGVVITTDGSIGEIPRENYLEAEEKTIRELQSIGKPFVVLVNSTRPFGEEARSIVKDLEEKYGTRVMAVNCQQLKEEDIQQILEAVLATFPITEVDFYIPKWVEMLDLKHKIKQDMISHIRTVMNALNVMGDAVGELPKPDSPYISSLRVDQIGMDTGHVSIRMDVPEQYYYEMISELTGTEISGQYELISELQNLSGLKAEYESVKSAFESVRMKGYGVVSPAREEIVLEEPSVIRQGNKYGVKIHATAPSIHLIRANVETEIAPIVGNEQQAKDLIGYIKETEHSEGGIWKTNIFGKSIEELVMDGMKNKMSVINDESQTKLQDTMQKILNESSGGLVCIII